MKASEVTQEMVNLFEIEGDFFTDEEKKEIIAAAVEAVFGGDTLLKDCMSCDFLEAGYSLHYGNDEPYVKEIGFRTLSVYNNGDVMLDFGRLHETKTIGQLRALEFGLGQRGAE